MRATKLGLSAVLGLSSVCLSATAFAKVEFAGQATFYQDALSTYAWNDDCVAYTVQANQARSETRTIGQPPFSSETVYVYYQFADCCSGPGIRVTYGAAEFEQAVDSDRRLQHSTLDIEVDIAGYDCLQTDVSFECTERTFAFVATVTWTGVGTITHVEEKARDPRNGVLYSKYERDEREAEATFAGLVDGRVIDYTTDDAGFQRIIQNQLTYTRP